MKLKQLFSILLCCLFSTTFALTFDLPRSGNDLVGQLQYIHAQRGEKIYDIAQQYDMGFYELIEANPEIPRHSTIPTEDTVIIPSEYVLPNVAREGIIINLPELRLYFYPGDGTVVTHPIAIGKYDWMTPTLTTKIIEKNKNPKWYVPKSIQEASARKGKILPDVVGAGPTNPLGKYAMRLGDRSYLIHGTINPQSIGKRASSGCMRMYPKDIKSLFQIVPVGTSVRIINEWYKLGWKNNVLYLEVHEPLQETALTHEEKNHELQTAIHNAQTRTSVSIDWHAVQKVLEEQNGLPVPISSTALRGFQPIEDQRNTIYQGNTGNGF